MREKLGHLKNLSKKSNFCSLAGKNGKGGKSENEQRKSAQWKKGKRIQIKIAVKFNKVTNTIKILLSFRARHWLSGLHTVCILILTANLSLETSFYK